MGKIKNIINKYCYNLFRKNKNVVDTPLYCLYEYKKIDGTFDYEKYQAIQKAGNERKRGKVWVLEENIKFLSQYIASTLPNVNFGLCHGTRQGLEQKWFKEFLGCQVLGTEISESASDYPDTIQWDFHDVKKDWLGATDFVYSNSFDHSYDPEKCLSGWMSCLRPGGVCILEHTSGHEAGAANQLDPFGAKLEIMPYLIARWGKEKYFLLEMLSAPAKRGAVSFCNYFILKNRA
jgi:hypothetical protein